MKRRDLFGLAAAGAAGWSLSAYGQQQGELRRVGALLGLAKGPDDPGAGEILRPLVTSIRAMGWTEDKNIRLDVRFGGGTEPELMLRPTSLCGPLPELIYVTGLPPALALR